MTEEHWARIREFPDYLISDQGAIFNEHMAIFMKMSYNNHGHKKITLTDHETGERYTRSVAKLVAEAFVNVPNKHCDQIAILDGNFENLVADNLVWRPRWFVWQYTRQMKTEQPLYFQNLSVMNVTRGFKYNSVIEAGMVEGLLFNDIWRSTYSGAQIFPHGDVFEVI